MTDMQMTKNRFLLLFLTIILWAGKGGDCRAQTGQKGIWDSPAACLGQADPGDTPRVFASGMLSDTGFFPMDRSAFSPDGTEFYYCVNNAWFSSKNLTVKVFRYDGKKWNGPSLLNEHFYAPVFSPDGNTLYFMGGKGIGEVWQSHRAGSGWTDPALYVRRDYGMYDFMPVSSGGGYAGSNGGKGNIRDFKTYDICRFTTRMGDTVIRSLGPPLNTPGFDGDFFIAKDESYMVISAKEQPDFECELYISYRKSDGTWTNPKSLGPLINDGPAHRWGEYVTPDNKYLIYSHGHSEKDCALYWVRFDGLLEKLKHTNFEPYVRSPLADRSGRVGDSFVLHIPENTFADDYGNHTLTYTARQANGDKLPSWLVFDPVKKSLSGKPAVSGTFPITITAKDPANASISCNFALKVSD